jgi:hypothetical protein
MDEEDQELDRDTIGKQVLVLVPTHDIILLSSFQRENFFLFFFFIAYRNATRSNAQRIQRHLLLL